MAYCCIYPGDFDFFERERGFSAPGSLFGFLDVLVDFVGCAAEVDGAGDAENP
jgi:hypothetical protein